MATVQQQKKLGPARAVPSQASRQTTVTRPSRAIDGVAVVETVSKSKRLGRPYKTVDTNLVAYDRTDPLAAVNALRKLLAMLPSRTGGNHLKLAVEEHKLAMHLLSIVEPFVSLEPSKRRSLTRQPTEILDEIASHVDSKGDLLALGLTCKRLADVVFPRHFSYRTLRAKLSNLAIWHHLSVHRTLARNVRHLEVLDERAPASRVLLPRDLLLRHGDTELEETSSDEEQRLSLHERQTRMFVGALARMTCLDAFIWSSGHPLVSVHVAWPTLLRWCVTLRTFQVNGASIFHPKLPEGEGARRQDSQAGARSLALTQLHSASFQSVKKGFGQGKKPELTDVVDMLHACPNLEELNINYSPFTGAPSTRADSLFQYGRWPALRALHLANAGCSPEGLSAASSFFAAHAGLEVLRLADFNVRALVLPAGALPRLRELHAPREFAARLMACPIPPSSSCSSSSSGLETCRPLETLEGACLAGPGCDADSDASFLAGLRRHPVKWLVLAGYGDIEDVRRLVACIPQVTHLDVGRKLASGTAVSQGRATSANTSFSSSTASTISSVTEWLDILSVLPDLTAFHGARFFYAVSENVLSTSNTTTTHATSSSAAATTAGTIPGTSIRAASNASDRSRLRKNDEIASLLAWKCPRLRRLDHWEREAGKVIVLSRDHSRGHGGSNAGGSEKVRWEVKRAGRQYMY